MKKLVLAFTMVVLLAAAVFGGQALASSKPADISVSEETSQEILFDWGSSYRGYPVRMKTFEGCFDAQDYPDGYSGNLLEEIYTGIRHVSVTISAYDFDVFGDDLAKLSIKDCAGITSSIDMDSQWPSPNYTTETFEFNTDNWHIFLITTEDSIAKYSYAVTVTYPSNQW